VPAPRGGLAIGWPLQERALRGGRFSSMPTPRSQQDAMTANIHDRPSIERVYPREAYASDASQNERRKPAMLRGVRIAAAPDDKGEFAIEPAVQHAGEVPGAVFLAPFHCVTAEENAAADPDPRLGYEAFLDEIIEVAQRLGFRADASPGPGDARLRGPRQ